MLPRKQRILLMIIIPLLIVLLIGLILVILIAKTDFMKSNDVLFKKYCIQNFSNISEITNLESLNMYDNILKTSNYQSTSDINITSSKNTENNINISIEGKTNNTSNEDYKNIQLKSNDNKLFQVEYIKQNDTYGIKFSDFFKEYISIKNQNLKDLVQKLGIAQEQTQNIPDSINTNFNILEGIEFTDTEKDQLINKYSDIIFSNIPENRYSKHKNAIITVDNMSLNTQAYQLTLSKEEYNNIVINVLENILQDEIILNKINILESNIQNYLGIDLQAIQIKQLILENLNEIIENIKNNNIGTEQIQITVYQYKGITVRTTIESEDKNIVIDTIVNQNAKKLRLEKSEISENENKTMIEIQNISDNGSNTYNINLENTLDGTTNQLSISINNGKVDNTINKDYTISYMKDENNINIDSKKIINLKEINKIEALEEKNIILNDLNSNQINNLINTVAQKISPNITSLFSEIINIIPEDIINLNKDENNFDINENDLTQLQKNRFNSQIEVYSGEQVQSSDIKNMLETIKNNLGGIEVVNNNVLKIKIERNKSNEELAAKISKVIQEGNNYKVEIQYDNTTGLINCIVLTKNTGE